MERADPRSRRDTYGSRINRAHSPALAYAVPWITIILASLLPMLPIASAAPVVPPIGLMVLVSWRLVRPGLLPVWAGFVFGAIDDLFSGQPFGSGILLWSLAMIAIEAVEIRFPWRSFVQDWLIAGLITTVYILAAALLSGAIPGIPLLGALVPQILLSLLVYPIIARMVSTLDRFRLLRIRILA
ncbi:rod shape-determining protein MreD [Pelagerythrobacter marensis]|uniref:Rod shape-determining protein MreD n=1 Tax=Pelagerythrobacter marensis TaxID=543877 RepID=A0A0G3X8I1_9SPHN|nr:rod shape-determining protein MreD [Pelagerythrobacter marensis]AKM06924.1 rod shape-determining protein MreD [Pelagerythrobacter marensis]